MITSVHLYRTSILFLIILLIISGCSKEDNTLVIPDDSDKYFWVHLNNDSLQILFNNLPKFSADGEEAIQLSSLIDTSLIHPFINDNISYDSRSLYSYQIVGDDGFSASGSKGYSNNIWEHFLLGHLLTSSRQVVFPDNKIDLAGAYDVKYARHIYIYRKFVLDFIDSTYFVELNNITSVLVTNPDSTVEEAIPLKDVVTNLINNPDDYQYNIVSLDNFGPTDDMTWEQLQTGYWLLSSEKTMFTDTTLVGGRYKLNVLEKIIFK